MGVSLKTRREAGRLSPLTAAIVWCRSVRSSGGGYFCLVDTAGGAYYDHAYYSYGVAPGFCA